MFKTITILLFALISVNVAAQKKPTLTDADTIVMTAKQQIELDLKEGSAFFEFVEKQKLVGSFDVDLTINEKGEVVSVFFQKKPDIEIKKLTYFREFLNEYKFNFKTPKGRKYKFNYQFNF
jgi:hypothetical protein